MARKIKRGSFVPWQCKTPEDYANLIHNTIRTAKKYGDYYYGNGKATKAKEE